MIRALFTSTTVVARIHQIPPIWREMCGLFPEYVLFVPDRICVHSECTLYIHAHSMSFLNILIHSIYQAFMTWCILCAYITCIQQHIFPRAFSVHATCSIQQHSTTHPGHTLHSSRAAFKMYSWCIHYEPHWERCAFREMCIRCVMHSERTMNVQWMHISLNAARTRCMSIRMECAKGDACKCNAFTVSRIHCHTNEFPFAAFYRRDAFETQCIQAHFDFRAECAWMRLNTTEWAWLLYNYCCWRVGVHCIPWAPTWMHLNAFECAWMRLNASCWYAAVCIQLTMCSDMQAVTNAKECSRMCTWMNAFSCEWCTFWMITNKNALHAYAVVMILNTVQ